MVVQHNLTALNANRYLGMNNSKLSKSLEKLSSGYAINRAGDNAAGLAVSEKMRSQIAGMTQGVKNAQDGISMVQTYEGALTEADSILQRMKTLATQSANGTYQDDVDREAIQLEFDQLNDELNQIADTDFNGVVALNGGQMADGTKAVNGKFDYANGVRDPKQLSAADINKLDYQIFDDSDNTNGITVADTVWKNIGGWDRKDPTADQGPDSVDVALKYNAEANEWTVESANNGADKTKLEVTMTDNGGFKLTDGTNDIANVVLDGTSLKNGDTIVLTLNNPKAGIAAPTNAGAVVTDTSDYTEGVATTALKTQDLNVTVALDDGTDPYVEDADMTEAIDKLYKQLDGATVTAKYTASTATTAGDMEITLKDGTVIKGADNGTFTLKDGTQFYATKTDGAITISTATAAGAADKTLAKISMTAAADTNDGSGSISYTIGLDYNSYDDSKLPNVEIKAPTDGAVSISNSNDAATAPLTYTDSVTLQVGARTKDSVNFTFKYSSNGLGDLKADLDCSARGLGTDKLALTSQEDANAAIDKIDNAINKVSMVRATFGAVQNRLEHKVDNLNVTVENLTSAESRIRDTDMATEMMNFTKQNILAQASQSMLAQANQLPQSVLSLLQ